ncbi:MAG: hypothetical protein LBJ01_12245 [Tannerella sp.]|jgi:hypothetical protein|nr:hypothetical protein [Tannerella sp.]
MKKIGILTGCLALILCACTARGKKTDTPVEYYGVSFICPAGWDVSKTEDYGAVQMVTIEKMGFSSSGILTVTLQDEGCELDDLLRDFMEAMEENAIFSNLKFRDVTDGFYGKYGGLACEYTTSVLSVPHQGCIYVFNANGKNLGILRQEATEDLKVNRSGFEKLAESFTVN